MKGEEMAKPSSTTITVSRTVQVKQYEPLVVTVSNTYDSGLSREGLEKEASRLGSDVNDLVIQEVKRARKSK
jgi:hypothetical protein